jgi:hypothetical protein
MRGVALFGWAAGVLLALTTIGADAQWLNYRTPGVPRMSDGTPNLTAPTPRTAGGTPDLSGVWLHEPTSVEEVRRLFGPIVDTLLKVDAPGMEIGTQHRYGLNILMDFPPNASPMRPETVALLKERGAPTVPADLCAGVPLGIPLADLLSEPMKIIQSPRMTVVLYEAGNSHRQIYSDGRSLPREFGFPAYLGYSVGRWEGETFVVETAGFNDKTLLDVIGHPHSEDLRVVERYQRRDFGHLDLEMTFDDQRMYTKPFTIRVPHNLLADSDIFESVCENEKDFAHLHQK